jgi:hypothetical protein
MALGALFVRLFYPGYIALREGVCYTQYVDGRLTSVLVYKHLRPVEILDFGNEIQVQREGEKVYPQLKNTDLTIGREKTLRAEYQSQILCIVDYNQAYHKLYRPKAFTELIISYDVQSAPDYSDADLAVYETLLDSFLNQYRFVTHDVSIRLKKDLQNDVPILQVATVQYDAHELSLKPDERLLKNRNLKFIIKQMHVAQFESDLPNLKKHDVVLATKRMASSLRLSPTQDILIKALEELEIGHNAHYAFLLAFIAGEAMLTAYLHEIKVKRGASKNKLKDYEDEVPFSYMLNVELPVLLGTTDEADRQIIGKVDGIRKKRNRVIHEAEHVSAEEALDAINGMNALHDMLVKRSEQAMRKSDR